MGIIETQSKKNLAILLFAVLFGAINNIILFPIALSKEEWGMLRFLPTVAIIGSNLALLGTPQILLRFMPAFVQGDKSNRGLMRYVILLSCIGLLILVSFLFFYKSSILGVYSENASSISDYYSLIFPILFLTFITELLSALSRAHFLSVFQLFLKEIVHRVVQSILLLILLLGWIDFELFIVLFSFSLIINVGFLLVFLKIKKILDLSNKQISSKEKKSILKYGGSSLLTTFGASLTGRIDSLMIPALVSGGVLVSNGGLEAIAIYAFGAYLVTIVEMPARAIDNISNSIIAKAWVNNNIKELKDIYQKTAINQMIVGGLLFVLIWAGIDELFKLIGGFEEAKWVIFYLGVGKIINISFGANGAIIVSSKFYYFAMFGMIFLAITTFVLNLIFIPLYGIEGAAIATLLALLMYNLLSFFLLKVKTRLQPFTIDSVKLIAILIVLFIAADQIKLGLSPLLEIIVISIALAIPFLIAVYYLKISFDMNKTIHNVIRKSTKLIARRIVFPILVKFKVEKQLNKAKRNAVLNIMYHGVILSKSNTIIRNINADKFEKHLIYLKENFTILSLKDAEKQINLGNSSAKQAITLSFDDGYENNLTVLLPILEKHNVPAAVYVLGFLSNDKNSAIKTVWSNYVDVLFQSNEKKELDKLINTPESNLDLIGYYDHIKELSVFELTHLLHRFESSEIYQKAVVNIDTEDYNLMSKEQIVKLSKSPLITIGSHAYWHCNLANQSLEDQKKELLNSKTELEKLIGREITSIAYPDGSYTRETIDLAEEIGYKDQWAVKYIFKEDIFDTRIKDRHGMATQTTFESNMVFLNIAFNKHSN